MTLANQYGRFIEEGRGYEIRDPATPRPWVNVVSNGRYGFVVSQNGGGFSWLDHCQLNVLTQWRMDHLRDDHGRFLYLSDLDEADSVWSVAPHPCRRAFDAFRCVHRAGSTTFESSLNGITASWTLGVAPDDQAELWKLTLTNDTDRPRRIRVGGFFQWCCDAAPDSAREFHRLFFTTRHDTRRHAVLATKNVWNAPFGTKEDHWNRPWPYVAGFAMGVAEGDRPWATSDTERFLGRAGDQRRPEGMLGKGCEALFGRFVEPCAAVGADVVIQPGQSITRTFVLGVSEDQATLDATFDKFAGLDAVDTALEATAAGWTERLAPSSVKTASDDFDLLNNHWLPYQAISARLWARSGYYQQSGAYGFRDQLQDSQVWLLRDPQLCKRQILLHAAHQFKDGSVYHWWNPITETGLHDQCSDDYLWLPFVLCSYIRETGDTSILDLETRFVDDPTPTPLREHAKRSIARSLSRFSGRGLPLIGDNDWNDGLSALGGESDGEKTGESIWLAFFLMVILDEFGTALAEAGDREARERYAPARAALDRAVCEHAWDGEWFRRATDASGRWLGSKDSFEGQIFLNAQTWAQFAKAGSDEQRDMAWDAVKERLLTPYGPLLLAPAYTVPDAAIGYLSRYAPGSRENGGVYMHAATWALAAAAQRRDVEAVSSIWKSISPPLRSKDAEAYAAEPYCLPGNVDGPLSPSPGRAGWTWYTGSAAWLNRVSIESIIGARAEWGGLRIDPCPMPEMGRVRAVRRWRGRDIVISFDAAEFDADHACVLTIDGSIVESNLITESMLPEGSVTEVTVAWAPAEPAAADVRVMNRERSQI
jgi:cellobiose phosphorylase